MLRTSLRIEYDQRLAATYVQFLSSNAQDFIEEIPSRAGGLWNGPIPEQ